MSIFKSTNETRAQDITMLVKVVIMPLYGSYAYYNRGDFNLPMIIERTFNRSDGWEQEDKFLQRVRKEHELTRGTIAYEHTKHRGGAPGRELTWLKPVEKTHTIKHDSSIKSNKRLRRLR